MIKNKCLALILAGGQSKKLNTLTKFRATPALPFGSKYRIIDFPLSNCINSGITTVGVITQYQPYELNNYIGTGSRWDMNRIHGGLSILSPYMKKNGNEWYKGTANAVYQNIAYIEKNSPEYVIILSGDQVYKMNYSKMLSYHISHCADCTIATANVNFSDSRRFGILITDKFNKITRFEEKPLVPKSTKASMGIYIFNWQALKKYLIIDNNKKTSSNDFGKDILPTMLNDGCKIYSYPFMGYWQDVGTTESLWKANMDLLSNNFLVHNSDWKIYSNTIPGYPGFIAHTSSIKRSIVGDGCIINGVVENSVIFSNVKIHTNSFIRNSVVFSDSIVCQGAEINNCLIDEKTTINENFKIGSDEYITIINKNSEVYSTPIIGEQSVVS